MASPYLLFLGKQVSISTIVESRTGRALESFFFSGWRIDSLYHNLLVRPFTGLAHWMRNEPVDYLYNALVWASQWSHRSLTALQTGELRWYATSMVLGLVLLVVVMLRNAS